MRRMLLRWTSGGAGSLSKSPAGLAATFNVFYIGALRNDSR